MRWLLRKKLGSSTRTIDLAWPFQHPKRLLAPQRYDFLPASLLANVRATLEAPCWRLRWFPAPRSYSFERVLPRYEIFPATILVSAVQSQLDLSPRDSIGRHLHRNLSRRR